MTPRPTTGPTDRPLLGVAAIVVTVFLWGMSGVAIKALSTGGMVTALYRLWFAIPLLWLTMLLPGMGTRLDAAWLRASLVGGVLFAIHQILYFTSLKLTSVANVTIIGALQPALVLLVAGRMFGERMTAGTAVWAAVAFCGVAMVVAGSVESPSWSPTGDLLATLNLFAFSAYFLASKRFRTNVGPWEYVVGMTTVSGLVMATVVFTTDQDLGSPAPWEWLVLVGIAVFPGTLGHALTNWAHAHVSAFVASTVLLAVPVVAVAVAYLLLGESLASLQLIGAAVVLGAIARIIGSVHRSAAQALAESAAATDAP